MIRRTIYQDKRNGRSRNDGSPKVSFRSPKYPQKLVGLQLYSVRDDMKLDPLGTLKQLSSIGYKYVEHADYVKRKFYGYEAKEFKKILDDLGLKMPSGHTVFTSKHWDESKKDFTDDWKYTIEDAATCGQQFVISPWLEEGKRKDADTLKGFYGYLQ
jgi:sugar phosphate isomerase/epimerase